MARLFSLQTIIALNIVTVNIYVYGTGEPLRVYRDDHDTFHNPSCFTNDGCNNCTAFNAKCTPSDLYSHASTYHLCTCIGKFKTYFPYTNSQDRCVADNELLYLSGRSGWSVEM